MQSQKRIAVNCVHHPSQDCDCDEGDDDDGGGGEDAAHEGEALPVRRVQDDEDGVGNVAGDGQVRAKVLLQRNY